MYAQANNIWKFEGEDSIIKTQNYATCDFNKVIFLMKISMEADFFFSEVKCVLLKEVCATGRFFFQSL